MTIFTNRELERVASLRMNWRKEFLLEVVRLRHERDIAKTRDRLSSAEAANIRSSADNRSTTSWPATLCPAPDLPHN
jgi:hypothetical protein